VNFQQYNIGRVSGPEWWIGNVVSYSGSSVVLSWVSNSGTGTFNDWIFYVNNQWFQVDEINLWSV